MYSQSLLYRSISTEWKMSITALYQLGIHCMCGLVDQDGLPYVHDSEEKRKLTSNIQHFTPSTGQWVSRATTGTPPLGLSWHTPVLQ